MAHHEAGIPYLDTRNPRTETGMDLSTMNGAAIHAPGGEPGTDPNGDGPQMGVPPVTVVLQREASSANAHNSTLTPPHAEDHDTEMPIYLA